MLNNFFNDLTSDTVVITASQRLSLVLSQLRRHYLQQGNETAPASILSFNTWLETTWRERCAGQPAMPALLTEYQEHTLWEKIIRQSPQGTQLLRTRHTAALALQAWQQLKRYGIPLTAHFEATGDTSAFKHWALAYEKMCASQGWLSPTLLPETLIPLLAAAPSSTRLIWVGFSELTPQQQKLLTALQTNGYSCEAVNFAQLNRPSPQLLKLAQTEDELLTMAQWVKQTLANTSDQHIIGCIITELQERRFQIEAVFNRILQPDSVLYPDIDANTVNLGATITLEQYPLISVALRCLNLLQTQIPLADFSVILRSPFLAGADAELTARASFDAKLHQYGDRTLTLNAALAAANSTTAASTAIHILRRQLQDAVSLQTRLPAAAPPSDWSAVFQQMLNILGWPGEFTLSSSEHQIKQRWLEALAEFEQLDFLLPALTLPQALHQLSQFIRSIAFQPQRKQARVYLLTPADAAGIPFDYLWIMGMNDRSWPPAPKPNPFLPFQLQQQYALPYAAAARTWHYHQQLLEQLAAPAQQVIFSYSLMSKEQALRPSALLPNCALTTVAELALCADAARTPQALIPLETIQDDAGPQLKPAEAVRGGISIFKDQAACPFRAFALYRLGARSLKRPQTGLSASERGNLLHKALEYFWKKTGSHAQLLQQTEPQLQNAIARAVTKALLELKSQRPQLLKPRFMALETQRLTALMQQWIAIEKQRPDFTVIATEQKVDYAFADIHLKIRIDRIDQLADGSRVIIDYKTGRCSENDWLGERLDDPQLPFYCITSPPLISGLVFAQISSQELKFKGIVHPDAQTLAPFNLKPVADWQQQRELWETAFNTLAAEFRSGHAKVNPKRGHRTCQFCEVKPLCRVHEQA